VSARPFDVVLFGATGFTGRLVAHYLATVAPKGLRVALAGRNREKLDAIRAGLPAPGTEWKLELADSSDGAAMERLAAETRVVCTTVGPYAKYGHPILSACAKAGTHYCDLTGEVQFMRDSIDRYDADAKRSGARLVHTCGFDSIPSDLGVLLLNETLGHLRRVTCLVEKLKGGLSGGTYASFINGMEEALADRARARMMADPYALSPDRMQDPGGRDERDLKRVTKDDFTGRWVAPFMMAPINTRVVRRSNALLGYAYGRSFRYREVSAVPRSAPAVIALAGLGLGVAMLPTVLKTPPLKRALLSRLPQAGEGPTEEQRERGSFRFRHLGESEDGRRASAIVAGQGDPGYKATSLMLGEAALCLALDAQKLPKRAGVLTPATAMGRVLIDRLVAQGMTFSVE
jgi:short subunit dehydrogenase-like uncharacterized protein